MLYSVVFSNNFFGLFFVFLLVFSQLHAVGKVRVGLGAVAVVSASYLGAQLYCGNSVKDVGVFLKELCKNPNQMGAMGPCSPYVGQAIVGCIPQKKAGQPRRILEVGAGTGAVSQELIKNLEPDDTVDLVEMQKPLCEMLKKKFCSTSEGAAAQVKVYCMPIQQFKSSYKYDSVLITVPFLACPFDVVKEIWEHVVPLLADGGTAAYVWHYGLIPSKLWWLGLVDKQKQSEFKTITQYLDALHVAHGAGQKLVTRNVSPLYVRYFKFDSPVKSKEKSCC